MTDLAKLVVSMEANTARFQKDMERVDRRLNALSKNAAAAGRAFGAAFGSLVTLGLGRAVRDISKFADSIGDSARIAGLSASDYQELRHAASQLDVEYGDLDTALIKFNDTLGDARRGSKEAAKAFTDLGLDPAQFKNTDEAFAAVTKRLGQVEDGFVRASLQSALFGRAAGPKMAEFLSTSSTEVERLRQEAHLLGVVMSDETIAAADQAEKKFAALSSYIKTNLARSFAELVPLIARATEELFKFLNAPSPLSADELAKQQAEVGRLIRLRDNIERNKGNLTPEQLRSYTGYDNYDAAMAYMSQRIRGAQELAFSTKTMMATPPSAAAASAPPVPGAKPTVIAATKEQIKLESDHARELERAREEVLLLNDAEGEEARMRALVNELYEQGKIPQADYLAYLEEASNRLTVLGEEADEAESKTNVFADQAARNIQSFTASLVDAALAGGDMGDAVIASLRRIAAELLTTSLVTGAFSILGIPGKAAGGPVKGGMPYVVGEEGPELFVPRKSGTIIPNDAMGGGGTSVTVNVDNRGATGEAAAMFARSVPALAAQIESKIAEGLARGNYRVRSA